MVKNDIIMSIIIPCYNSEKYLADTIESILNQNIDISKLEIILINDGSSDNTLKICKKYESEYIKIIDKINTGVSDSRNKGIETAIGKYILFLDSDDYLQKNSIKNIVSFFDKYYNDIDLVTYPLKFFSKKGKFNTHFRYDKYFINGTGVYDLNVGFNSIQSTINVCIKNDKKVFFNVNQSYSEDELFITEVLMNKKKIGYVKEAGYCYRRHTNNITAHKNDKDFEKIYKYYDYLLEKYHNHPYIQTIILNNFRWRIEENCLYPKNLKEKDIEKYNINFFERIQKIDVAILAAADYLTLNQKILILGLGNKKIYLENNDNNSLIYCENELICSLNEIKINIEQIKLNDNILNIDFSFLSYIIESFNFEITIECEYFENKRMKHKKYNIINQNNYKTTFQTVCDINQLKKVSFYLETGNKKINLITIYDKFCSYSKKYLKYNLLISDNIIIKKANIFTEMINKIFYCKNNKVRFISFLSLFYYSFKDLYLYIEEINGNNYVYKKYVNDKLKKDKIKRKYYKAGTGILYKLCILSAKKIYLSNDTVDFLQFGKANKDYIQASNFVIELINK